MATRCRLRFRLPSGSRRAYHCRTSPSTRRIAATDGITLMPLRVDYQGGQLEFDADANRLIAAWEGPPDASAEGVVDRIRLALEAPLDFPPLRRVVVPGDRVVIPFDRSLPEAATILGEIAAILREVEVESITVVIDGREPIAGDLPLPEGITLEIHDPSDRESLSYLATTEAGRRIYINRIVSDADCVIPVGRLGYDETLDVRGPWSVIEPGLGDATYPTPSLLASRRQKVEGSEEPTEVSWLLGSQFQIAGVPGRGGLLHLIAGETSAIRVRGAAMLDASWLFTLEDRADLVIAGIGGPGRKATVTDFIAGFRTALRAVARGGKLALLTALDLATIREALRGPTLPRGDLEKALAWADVYLMSTSPADDIENLGMIAFDRPAQAAKLAASAHSLVTITQADRTRTALLS